MTDSTKTSSVETGSSGNGTGWTDADRCGASSALWLTQIGYLKEEDLEAAIVGLTAGYRRAIAREREACAEMVDAITMGEMLLAGGEMTAQERRTLRAFQKWIAWKIRSRKDRKTTSELVQAGEQKP